MNMESLADLSDIDVLARVERLVHSERQATAVLVAHLAEIANRKLYVAQGYASLFSYCVQALHLSEHAAYNRIEAARVSMRYPAVLSSLARGDVHLTAVRLLSPLFTPENHRELLAAAKHRSKREVEELIARLRPQPDVPAAVRRLPPVKARNAATGPTTGAEGLAAPNYVTGSAAGSAASSTMNSAVGSAAKTATQSVEDAAGDSNGKPKAGPPARPAVVVPLAPERYKVQFTASAATREKLRRAQELLCHRIPGGDVAEVIDLALDLLVRDLEKKKFAATERPRTSGAGVSGLRVDGPAAPGASRHIPAEVKRAVWQRDQGRCAFVGSNGVRCTERGPLEFDHIRPHADGGTAGIGNVRLLCRRHNQHEARQFFGLWQAEAAPGTVPR